MNWFSSHKRFGLLQWPAGGKGDKALGILRTVVGQVSTRPIRSSYVWGGRRTPLPLVTFFGIHLLRLLSPLQWLKFAVRRLGNRGSTTNIRPDFLPAYTDWYFISVGLLSVGFHILNLAPVPGALTSVTRAMAIVLSLECFTWILYYLLLRNFVEAKYTIFHPAEYLVTFPIVVIDQVLLTSYALDRHIVDVLSAMIGNPSASDRVGVVISMVAIFYFGVAVSVVLSSHPGIRTRPPLNIVVLGAGEVTHKRIVPALERHGYDRDDLIIATLDEELDPDGLQEIAELGQRFTVFQLPSDKLLLPSLQERSPTIIASPTYAHFQQMVSLANAGVIFAIEKPITAFASERDVLTRNPGIMKAGFALSYYALEKALPLTYFYKPIPAYARFLKGSRSDLLRKGAIEQVRLSLGELVAVDITVCEGLSRSPRGRRRLWTELPGTLRPFLETTIHPLLVARHLLGTAPIAWSSCALGRFGPRSDEVREMTGEEVAPTWIYATGQVDRVKISMEVGKYMPSSSERRRAVITFRNGRAIMDFDTRMLSLEPESGEQCWIAIDDESEGGRYRQNYAVQMGLFREFIVNGWGEVRFDDYENQLIALADWDDLCSLVDRCVVPVSRYESGEHPSLSDATPLALGGESASQASDPADVDSTSLGTHRQDGGRIAAFVRRSIRRCLTRLRPS